jgi:hypothetical protein
MIIATSTSSALKMSMTTSTRPFESALVASGMPLRATALEHAATELAREGVARVDGVFDAARCAALRARVFALAADAGSDRRYVPGTRLRYGDALNLPMGETRRTDVLLPLDDALVADALRAAASHLHAPLAASAAVLPDDDGAALDLVECGALIAWPGAPHQPLHADFRREPAPTTAALSRALSGRTDGEVSVPVIGRLGRLAPAAPAAASPSAAPPPPPPRRRAAPGEMPPRLVCFVYLQVMACRIRVASLHYNCLSPLCRPAG